MDTASRLTLTDTRSPGTRGVPDARESVLHGAGGRGTDGPQATAGVLSRVLEGWPSRIRPPGSPPGGLGRGQVA